MPYNAPQAARSVWVQKELEEWLSQSSVKNLILILTDGKIKWDEKKNDFDWLLSTALPENLSRRFQEEPLWVNLRW